MASLPSGKSATGLSAIGGLHSRYYWPMMKTAYTHRRPTASAIRIASRKPPKAKRACHQRGAAKKQKANCNVRFKSQPPCSVIRRGLARRVGSTGPAARRTIARRPSFCCKRLGPHIGLHLGIDSAVSNDLCIALGDGRENQYAGTLLGEVDAVCQELSRSLKQEGGTCPNLSASRPSSI